MFADPTALAKEAAELIATTLQEAPGPRVSLGLAGGHLAFGDLPQHPGAPV